MVWYPQVCPESRIVLGNFNLALPFKQPGNPLYRLGSKCFSPSLLYVLLPCSSTEEEKAKEEVQVALGYVCHLMEPER